MSRKGLLAGLLEEDEFTAVNPDAPTAPIPSPRSGRGAFGMMSRAADEMATKVEAAQEIERKLLAGESVIELDPDQMDSSFVLDRMEQDDARLDELVEAIKERGQDSPILVRPHPTSENRYQIVFGHRRVKAARLLGRPVRAVVKPLTDREHVVAQGQENSARADLSFIERAIFAAKLAESGFDNQIIMTALSVNKTVVSKMASVTKQIPVAIIEAVGAARGIGRDRWYDLSLKFRIHGNAARAVAYVARTEFGESDSDERFNSLFDFLPSEELKDGAALHQDKAQASTTSWVPADKSLSVTMKTTGKAFTLALKDKDGTRFGDWISQNLEGLYQAFRQTEKTKTGD